MVGSLLRSSPGSVLDDELLVSLVETDILPVLVLHDSATNIVFSQILRREVRSAAGLEKSLLAEVIESLFPLHKHVMGGSHNLK